MGTPRPARHIAAIAVLAAALASGCGASNHINLGAPPTPTTTIDPNADGGNAAAILAAYRGSLVDFNHVATTAPLDPNAPQLGDHMAGDELSGVVRAFTKLKAAGEINGGSLTSIDAYINQYNGTQAVVVSCEHDSVSILDASSHKMKPGGAAANSNELVNALVSLQGSTWKVTRSTHVSPGCS